MPIRAEGGLVVVRRLAPPGLVERQFNWGGLVVCWLGLVGPWRTMTLLLVAAGVGLFITSTLASVTGPKESKSKPAWSVAWGSKSEVDKKLEVSSRG